MIKEELRCHRAGTLGRLREKYSKAETCHSSQEKEKEQDERMVKKAQHNETTKSKKIIDKAVLQDHEKLKTTHPTHAKVFKNWLRLKGQKESVKRISTKITRDSPSLPMKMKAYQKAYTNDNQQSGAANDQRSKSNEVTSTLHFSRRSVKQMKVKLKKRKVGETRERLETSPNERSMATELAPAMAQKRPQTNTVNQNERYSSQAFAVSRPSLKKEAADSDRSRQQLSGLFTQAMVDSRQDQIQYQKFLTANLNRSGIHLRTRQSKEHQMYTHAQIKAMTMRNSVQDNYQTLQPIQRKARPPQKESSY